MYHTPDGILVDSSVGETQDELGRKVPQVRRQVLHLQQAYDGGDAGCVVHALPPLLILAVSVTFAPISITEL